jgi:hypothetical protein
VEHGSALRRQRTHASRSAAQGPAARSATATAGALRVARTLHTAPRLRASAQEEAPAAAMTSSKRAALEEKLAQWEEQVEALHKETEMARRAWAKSPTDIAAEKLLHAAAKDALASAKEERNCVLQQLQMLGGCLAARFLSNVCLQTLQKCAPRPRPTSLQVACGPPRHRLSRSEC